MKRLFSTIKCSTCGQKHKVGNIRIIDHQGGLWFLNAYCNSCGTKGLIVAVVEDGRATEVITDLTEADYNKFSYGEVVGMDDVLDMHNLLKEFDGDFVSLFTEK